MFMLIGIVILLVFLYFIYFGFIVIMIVFLCFDSKLVNKYGESLKYLFLIKN